MSEPKGWRVSGVADEDGAVPKDDPNPPVGRPLRKVLNSRPMDNEVPVREKKKPWEKDEDDRESE